MDIIGIKNLSTIADIVSSDLLHLVRPNDFSMLLSYKSKTNEMCDVFIKASVIADMQKKIDTAISELKTVSASMLLRKDGDSTYAKTDTINSKTPGLITNSSLAAEISKFPKEETLNAKRNELYAEARRLADEMTDFTGAAMVGINQSNAAFPPSVDETEEKD